MLTDKTELCNMDNYCNVHHFYFKRQNWIKIARVWTFLNLSYIILYNRKKRMMRPKIDCNFFFFPNEDTIWSTEVIILKTKQKNPRRFDSGPCLVCYHFCTLMHFTQQRTNNGVTKSLTRDRVSFEIQWNWQRKRTHSPLHWPCGGRDSETDASKQRMRLTSQ